MNSDGSFTFIYQKLINSLLFDLLWNSWKQATHFDTNTMQTTVFTKS